MNARYPLLSGIWLWLTTVSVGAFTAPLYASSEVHVVEGPHPFDFEFFAGVFIAVVAALVLVWCVPRNAPLQLPLSDENHDWDPSKYGRSPDVILRLGKWFIRMRWLACGISFILIVLTIKVLGYLEDGPFVPLMLLLALLALSNVAFTFMLKRRRFIKGLLQIQIASDLLLLTALIHFSGGIENPLAFAYVFHVLISGILLDAKQCYATAIGACVLFLLLAIAELRGLIGHYTLEIFPHELETGVMQHASHDPLYVGCRIFLQFLWLLLVGYFISSIMTRLREHEVRARAERERLERVVNASGAGFAILNANLHPLWMNRQIQGWLTGIFSDRRSAVPALKQWTDDIDDVRAKTLHDGVSRIVERERIVAGGERRVFQVTIAPLLDSAGHMYQVAELTQDITQRKRAEAAVMHAAKMAALGTMAAGIAHEVGNPLASLSARLDLLRENHDERFITESISLLRDQINRISRIVRDITNFARPAQAKWTAFDLNALMQETLNMLRLHRLGKQCSIEMKLDPSLPPARGVRDQFCQIFLNLGLNALEAMKGKGTLTMTTAEGHGEIRVSFADTGEGIRASIREAIFEPFVSSKEGGLGLGLSIVKTVAEAHGGRIEADNGPDGGAIFNIFLPVEGGAADGHSLRRHRGV